MTRSGPPGLAEATPFAVLPAELRRAEQTSAWAREVLDADHIGSFLEGPCFGRDGTLYVSDLAHGRILAVDPGGHVSVHADYDGEPNGLALHADGRLFIADYRLGIMTLDSASTRPRPAVTRYRLEPFRGVSDLVFAGDGTLYFSDQGQSDLRNPTGRLFRWTESGGPQLLMDGIPSPNGVALSPAGDALYVAVTRANCVYRVPLRRDGTLGKASVYLHTSGGSGGPDGLAVNRDGGLAVAHYGLGRVWMFDQLGQPAGAITTRSGLGTTNVAYGGPDGRELYITEAQSGSVLRAPVEVAGLALYAFADGGAEAAGGPVTAAGMVDSRTV